VEFPESSAVLRILRAVADARNGPLYALWVSLRAEPGRPGPESGVRIYPVADRPDAHLVTWVAAHRGDGREVSWSVGVTARPDSLEVIGTVEVGDDSGRWDTVYESASTTVSAVEAATAVLDQAAAVAEQRRPGRTGRRRADAGSVGRACARLAG
jgi:hypothetical protein